MPALVVDGRSGKEMFYNAVIAAITGWEDVRNDPLKAIRCGGGERRLDAEGCERRLFTAAGVGRYGDGEELGREEEELLGEEEGEEGGGSKKRKGFGPFKFLLKAPSNFLLKVPLNLPVREFKFPFNTSSFQSYF